MLWGVHLVHHEQVRDSRPQHFTRHRQVQLSWPCRRVGDDERQVGLGRGQPRLRLRVRRHGRRVAPGDSSRIHDRQAASPPLDFSVNPIPRRPRFVGHHRHPRAHQAIEQRGLADIRTAHDRNQRRAACHRCDRARTAAASVSHTDPDSSAADSRQLPA